MSQHGPPQGSVAPEIKAAIESAMPGARAEVRGGGGHYEITVRSTEFTGKSTLQKQRMVLSAVKHLMSGDGAPLHAVDKLETLAE